MIEDGMIGIIYAVIFGLGMYVAGISSALLVISILSAKLKNKANKQASTGTLGAGNYTLQKLDDGRTMITFESEQSPYTTDKTIADVEQTIRECAEQKRKVADTKEENK